MEIKSVGRPREPADDEEDPVFERELGEERYGVLDGIGLVPLASRLTVGVGEDYALLPDEQVTP